jgi:P2-related tail formation protein
VVQDYSTTSTYSWSSAGRAAGTYQLEVDVRDQGAGGYEVWSVRSYTLSACTAAGLSASPPGHAATGTTVTLTATASCPGTPTYRFLVNGTMVQDYSTTSTFSWNTTGKAAGTYQLEVDVRDQGAGSYEVWSIISYTLS